MRPLWREKMVELSGNPDIGGMEISGMIRRLANIYDAIFNLETDGSELTGPRMSILIRLYVDEMMGSKEGITPTFLSHMQNVGKNTISSLVRGLEDQGYIQRENDPADRRIYRLRLTDTGRELIIKQAPVQLEYLNNISSGLNAEERTQLIHLLEKLLTSLIEHSHIKKNKVHES